MCHIVKGHKNEWPSLTRLALSYLSCPPSSVTSERVFSLTGNIVTKKRCALLPGNIGRLAFIKLILKILLIKHHLKLNT